MTADFGKGVAALVLALSLALPAAARAQDGAEDEGAAVSVGAQVDVASNYVWRGLQISDKANLQPSIWLDYGSFELGTWGSHEFKGDDGYHEQDFWLTYFLPEAPVGSFSLTLNDYYVNSDFGSDLFDFDGVVDCGADEGVGDPPRCASGPHTLELAGAFSASAIPLDLLLAYNIHNDPQSAPYAEAVFHPEVAGFELGFTAGGVLGESQWYYGTADAGFTNLGASIGRSLEAGRFSIPLSAQIVRNPTFDETYYVLSAGISAEL